MSDPLLATKLYIPRTRPRLVPRPRLIDKLNLSSQYKLTLISAPAGFGKTTLLNQWADQAGHPLAWLSVDERDNEYKRFLSYMLTALQQLDRRLGQSVLPALQGPQPPSMESLLTRLIDDIITVEIDVILVLDEYQLIKEDSPVHQAMAFMFDHSSCHIHFVIATRSDPPLPLSRLRARGQLSEIVTDEMRFTLHESRTFLNQTMGLKLSSEEVLTLKSRTEGWVTGLQLAALSIQNPQKRAAIIDNFSGRHPHILDYLTSEVVDLQAEPLRSFLLQTSILDRLSGPLCDAVTGQNNSQSILEKLEAANLFLIPVDNERRWYRYHHLFTDCLQHYLQTLADAETVAVLHQRASAWFNEQGLFEDAVRHALLANDPELAADLVEAVLPQLSPRTEKFRTLFGLLNMLPESVIRNRIRLSLEYSWALFITGNYSAAVIESFLEPVARLWSEKRHLSAKTLELLGIYEVIRSLTATMRGNFDLVTILIRQALEHLPADNLQWRSSAVFNLGLAELARGDLIGANQAFEEAYQLAVAYSDYFKVSYILSFQGYVQSLQGHLHHAAMTYQQIIDLTHGPDARMGDLCTSVGMAHVRLGELKYEWNDLEGAAQTLHKGMKLSQQWEPSGTPEIPAIGYTVLARLHHAQGDLEGASAMLHYAEQAVQRVRSTHFLGPLRRAQTRIWLTQGDFGQAFRWAASVTGDDKTTEPPFHGLLDIQIALSRIRLTQHQRARDLAALKASLVELQQLQEAAEARGYANNALKLLVQRALTHQSLGDMRQAQDLLLEALMRAEPEGYIRLFVDEGTPMAQLLLRFVKQQQKERRPINRVSSTYLDQILRAMGLETKLTPIPNGSSVLDIEIDSLTRREIEVLNFVAAGMSNREISQELVISTNTIKRHLSNIYRKLEVGGRLQAVALAQAMGLV